LVFFFINDKDVDRKLQIKIITSLKS